MLPEAKYIRALFLALPGLLFAIWADHLLHKAAGVSDMAKRLGVDEPYGKYFGPNPFVYHIAGLYLGFTLCIIFSNMFARGCRFWISTAVFVFAGVLILVSGDFLLGITAFSLAPGLELYESTLRSAHSVEAEKTNK